MFLTSLNQSFVNHLTVSKTQHFWCFASKVICSRYVYDRPINNDTKVNRNYYQSFLTFHGVNGKNILVGFDFNSAWQTYSHVKICQYLYAQDKLLILFSFIVNHCYFLKEILSFYLIVFV